MNKNIVYCDECKFLEEHGVFSEEADECGRFEEIETKFYCRFQKKYFDFEANKKTIGLCACAYGEDDSPPCSRLEIDALDLINRQKEEIEHYKKAFFNSQNIFSDQALENECMKAEIDSMKEKLKLYSYYKEPFVKQIKSEAIKEFARRVKATFPTRDDPHCTDDDIFTLDSIDRIMNDMLTGEKT